MAFLDKTGLEYLWLQIVSKLGNKVDKVDGKGLSTNDYTTDEKEKLAGIATGAANVTVDSTLSSTSTNPVENKIVTASINNLNTLVGDTAVATQISNAVANKSDVGHTHTMSNISDLTATADEINYLDGVTSNVQTQLNAKQATITGGASTITSSNLTTSRALVSNSSGKVVVSAVTSTELGYLDGVTSNVQTQLDGKSSTGHTHNYAGSSSAGGAATTALACTGNSATATQLATARTINGVSFDGSANITVAANFGITTAGTGAAYTATVDGVTSLTSGVSFTMIPHTISTTTAPTLNVNSLGAKTIRRRVSNSTTSTYAGYNSSWLAANKPIRVEYDGTYWIADLPKPSAADMSGTLTVAKGGTGATDAEGALINLGALPRTMPNEVYLQGETYTGVAVNIAGIDSLDNLNIGNSNSPLYIYGQSIYFNKRPNVENGDFFGTLAVLSDLSEVSDVSSAVTQVDVSGVTYEQTPYVHINCGMAHVTCRITLAADGVYSGWVELFSGLPKARVSVYDICPYRGATYSTPLDICIDTDGSFWIRRGTAGSFSFYVNLCYPIGE